MALKLIYFAEWHLSSKGKYVVVYQLQLNTNLQSFRFHKRPSGLEIKNRYVGALV